MTSTNSPEDPNQRQPGQAPDEQDRQPDIPPWYAFLWMSAAILLMMFWLEQGQQAQRVELPYSEFTSALEAGQIEEVTLRGEHIQGRFSEQGSAAYGGDSDSERFYTVTPPMENRELLTLLESHDVTIRAEPAEPPWWQEMLVGALPWILLLALLFGFWSVAQKRMMQGSGPFSFGKSQAHRVQKEESDTTLDDVAGIDSAKQDVTEIVDFLKSPAKYRALGASMPKGILLVGPPGTGKTLLARAIAGEADVPFFSVSASQFIEMFVGVGASRVRDMFDTARKEPAALIFIDELDEIGRAHV